jgi:hypothetical protein
MKSITWKKVGGTGKRRRRKNGGTIGRKVYGKKTRIESNQIEV